jgi:hypothetical protein
LSLKGLFLCEINKDPLWFEHTGENLEISVLGI